ALCWLHGHPLLWVPAAGGPAAQADCRLLYLGPGGDHYRHSGAGEGLAWQLRFWHPGHAYLRLCLAWLSVLPALSALVARRGVGRRRIHSVGRRLSRWRLDG